MKLDNWEHKIRKKMRSFNAEPSGDVWSQIEQRLPAEKKGAGALWLALPLSLVLLMVPVIYFNSDLLKDPNNGLSNNSESILEAPSTNSLENAAKEITSQNPEASSNNEANKTEAIRNNSESNRIADNNRTAGNNGIPSSGIIVTAKNNSPNNSNRKGYLEDNPANFRNSNFTGMGLEMIEPGNFTLSQILGEREGKVSGIAGLPGGNKFIKPSNPFREKHWQISAGYSHLIFRNKYYSNGISRKIADQAENAEMNGTGKSFDISFSYMPDKHWEFRVGIGYSVYNQIFKYKYQKIFQDSIYRLPYNFSFKDYNYEYGGPDITSEVKDFNNTSKMINIPVTVSYHLVKDNFDLAIGGGVKFQRLIFANLLFQDEVALSVQEVREEVNNPLRRNNMILLFTPSLGYNLTRNVKISFDPVYQYSMLSSFKKDFGLKRHPVSWGGGIRVGYKF